MDSSSEVLALLFGLEGELTDFGELAAAFGDPNIPYTSLAINNIYKTATILANESEVLEPGIVLGAQKTIVARGTSNLTISAYGVELS